MKKRGSQTSQKASEATGEPTRVTLDLSPAGYARLQRLAKAAGVTSATVLRQSLQLYEHVVEEMSDGKSFKSVDSSGKETDIKFIGFTD